VKADPLDLEILETYKELNPSAAFLQGFNQYAGKLFIPSSENIQGALRRVRELRRRAKTGLQEKFLDALEVALLFDEPQPILDDIVGTIFNHLAKEGVNERHMLSLLSYSSKAIDATRARFEGRDVPTGVKALCLYRLGGIIEILDAVKATAKVGEELKGECDRLKAKAAEFVKLFELDGFGEGRFEEVESVFRRYGFDLGRKDFYRMALGKGFDYDETPEELETKAISWIDDELPRFRGVVEKLAKLYGCEADTEEVEKGMNARLDLKPSELLKVTRTIRNVVQRFADLDIVRINPGYRTKLIETPSYLTGVMPTGAAQFFDTFTKRPFQIFFQTTDPKRDPDKSVSALLDLLVHEEYGHCVHHSNSALGFMGELNPLYLIPGLLSGPITEGLSFNREREFLEAVRRLETKKRLSKVERDYIGLMKKYGGLELLNLEVEFSVRKWRLIRFLRVVGDVRLNTGKQGLLEFVDWAHEYTGVPRSNVYFQLFPAHEGIFPGYATAYAVVGQEIMSIEKKIKDQKKRVKFSTYLCSIGYPPRSAYRKMLSSYAKKLR
jgi:hypothetical protein